VKFWKNAAELPGLVSLNLSHAMNAHAGVGWVRADKAANAEVLGEINEVRKQNDRLQKQVTAYKRELRDLAPQPALQDLAGLDEQITLGGTYRRKHYNDYQDWNTKTTWRKIYGYISPYLVRHPSDDDVKQILADALFDEAATEPGSLQSFDDQDFRTVGVQLKALGLVSIDYTQTTAGGMGLFWSLTGAGERLMVEIRAVRSIKPAPARKSAS